MLAVSSVGPITVALQTALQASIPISLDLGWRLRNASVTTFLYTPDRMTLDGFNSARASGKCGRDHVPLAIPKDVGCVTGLVRRLSSPNPPGHVMDFSIPDPLRETLKKVRKFLMDEVYPLEVDLLSRPFRELLPTLTAKRDRVREMGLFTPQVPKDHGGAGLKFMEHALLSEELGRTPLGHFVFNCQAPDAGNMEILHDFGTPSRKRRGSSRWWPGKFAVASR